ncbi:MAG: carbohydrate binding family 9 domain-containing protein, partial [Calditrichaeota bacterium]|nr:carbohydrate binding family 9 domain-containing protein [Calditrichota bacterium]
MRIILTFISLITLSQAQPSKDEQVRTLVATKISQPIEIDGQMDALWSQAQKQDSFTQEEPSPLEPATQKTEFRFLYDDENIYFFIRVHDNKDEIITQTGRRDNAFWNGDWVLIYLDPQHDKTTGFRFGVNPSNVQHDARLYNDGWDDDRWDAIWYSQTSEWEGGWQAEVRIPLRAIKFQEKDVQTWGLNV